MTSRFLIFLILAIIVFNSCKKDEPTDMYLRGGNSIVNTLDGNMLIAGFNNSSDRGYDGYLIKVSPDGSQLWSKNYGSNYTDGFYNAINASDGGYVAVGFQSVGSYGESILYILKTDDQGDKQWEYLSDGLKMSKGFGVTQTSDNGYLACGYIQEGNSDRDLYLVKVNANGEKVWEKQYGTKNDSTLTGANDDAYAIIAAGDSGFYLTGSMNGDVNCCGKSFLMKIAANGDSLWTKSYSEALGFSLSWTSDGNIIIGGAIYSNGQDAYLIKTNALGEKIWEKSYGSTTGYDFGTTVVQASDGGYAITGFSSKSGNTNQDVSLFRVNAGGTLLWSYTYGGDNIDQGFGLVRNLEGGYFIAGMSNSGGSYVFLNKTDGNGIEIWQKKLN
jgi:hypothetical protein